MPPGKPSVAVSGTEGLAVADVKTRPRLVSWLMTSFRFELYVAGDASRSRTAVRALTELCEERLRDRYELVVIDVLAEPERAERARILATPTLLKLSPAPRARIIGDLSLKANVLAGIGLSAQDDGDERRIP